MPWNGGGGRTEDEVERRLHGEGGSAHASQGEAVWRDSDQAYKFCPGTTDGPTTEPSHFVGKYLCWAPDLTCGEQQTFALCITQQAAVLRWERISVRALRPLNDGARADTSGSFLCREKTMGKSPWREHSGNDRSGMHRLWAVQWQVILIWLISEFSGNRWLVSSGGITQWQQIYIHGNPASTVVCEKPWLRTNRQKIFLGICWIGICQRNVT